jgi:Cu+-exporting ATPase
MSVPPQPAFFPDSPRTSSQEISDIGFDATQIPITRSDTVNLRIYGMTCGACTSAIENNLTSKPGILSVAVSLPLNSAKVEFDRTMVGPETLSNGWKRQVSM